MFPRELGVDHSVQIERFHPFNASKFAEEVSSENECSIADIGILIADFPPGQPIAGRKLPPDHHTACRVASPQEESGIAANYIDHPPVRPRSVECLGE